MNSTKSFLSGALALSFDNALRRDMEEEVELERITRITGETATNHYGSPRFAYPWPVKVRKNSRPLKQRKARAKARRQRKLNNKRK